MSVADTAEGMNGPEAGVEGRDPAPPSLDDGRDEDDVAAGALRCGDDRLSASAGPGDDVVSDVRRHVDPSRRRPPGVFVGELYR